MGGEFFNDVAMLSKPFRVFTCKGVKIKECQGRNEFWSYVQQRMGMRKHHHVKELRLRVVSSLTIFRIEFANGDYMEREYPNPTIIVDWLTTQEYVYGKPVFIDGEPAGNLSKDNAKLMELLTI